MGGVGTMKGDAKVYLWLVSSRIDVPPGIFFPIVILHASAVRSAGVLYPSDPLCLYPSDLPCARIPVTLANTHVLLDPAE